MPVAVSGERPAGPDAVLRALADPNRRRILRLVRSEGLAAGEVAAHFEMTQQAVSLHLKVLRGAGLLAERRQGARRIYSLNPEPLDLVRALLDDLWLGALVRLKSVVEQDLARNRNRSFDEPA
jgi:DNA-binding transcriptional ArsR family regulator